MNYYFSNEGVLRYIDTAHIYDYPTNTTHTWTISPTSCRKKHREPIDDFPKENEKLDKFLGAFAQKGTNDGK